MFIFFAAFCFSQLLRRNCYFLRFIITKFPTFDRQLVLQAKHFCQLLCRIISLSTEKNFHSKQKQKSTKKTQIKYIPPRRKYSSMEKITTENFFVKKKKNKNISFIFDKILPLTIFYNYRILTSL